MKGSLLPVLFLIIALPAVPRDHADQEEWVYPPDNQDQWRPGPDGGFGAPLLGPAINNFALTITSSMTLQASRYFGTTGNNHWRGSVYATIQVPQKGQAGSDPPHLTINLRSTTLGPLNVPLVLGYADGSTETYFIKPGVDLYIPHDDSMLVNLTRDNSPLTTPVNFYFNGIQLAP
ncbi:MAG: hypothetical protein ABSH53_17360 [Holophaga sp.]|jgi:hypothetical protein